MVNKFKGDVIIELFNIAKDKYGEEYENHTLEQWKTCVEMADNISERRVNSNNFFLTLNSVILAISVMFKSGREVVVSIIGIFIVFLWIETINNYKKLNSHKFKIINELEKELPSKPYSYEWHIMGNGYNKEKYKRLTDIEKITPVVFGIIYVILIIYYIFIK